MNRVTLISLGALLGMGALTTTLVACEQKAPAVPEPAVAVDTEPEATAANDDADDPCAKWIAQGVNCEYITFEAMEIRPHIEGDQALATTEL